MVCIDPGFYCFCALSVLILPLPWLLGAAFAALIHELGHLIAIFFFHGTVYRISVAAGGMEITAGLPDRKRELLAILAGPAGSFLLMAATYRWMSETALCGLIQGLFNLLPIYPLDGGRAVRCLLALGCPGSAGKVSSIVESITLLILLTTAGYASAVLHMGMWPMALVLFLVFGWIRRKIPCKRGRIGVQ